MTHRCTFCGFMLLESETSSFCCQNGKTILKPWKTRVIPDEFRQFFQRHVQVLKLHSRIINAHSCATSVGIASTSDEGVQTHSGSMANSTANYGVLRIEGKPYHFALNLSNCYSGHNLIGSAVSYIYCDDESKNYTENNERQFGHDILRVIVELRQLLRQFNHYYRTLSTLQTTGQLSWSQFIVRKREIDSQQNIDDTRLRHRDFPSPQDQYVVEFFDSRKKPRNEVISLTRRDYTDTDLMDDRLLTDDTKVTISLEDSAYEALAFPLKDPMGVSGWNSKKQSLDGKQISLRKFVKHTLIQNQILQVLPKLYQEYALDMLSRIEIRESRFLANLLKNIKSSTRQDVQLSASLSEAPGNFLIPKSIRGSPGYQKLQIRRGLAHCSMIGLPQLFITFTLNDQWPDLLSLLNGDEAEDHPELMNRIFNFRLGNFIEKLRTGHYFNGRRALFIQYVIEWQMRGRPHAHLLVRLQGPYPETGEQVDELISASIPACERSSIDVAEYSRITTDTLCTCKSCELKRFILDKMVHDCSEARGCYDPPRGNKAKHICKSHFPQPIMPTTTLSEHGVWLLKRKKDEVNIVSYNAQILMEEQAHINIVVPYGTKTVTYMRKYMSKIPKKLSVRLKKATSNMKAIEAFYECRSISAGEAIWVLFDYSINYFDPPVTILPVHLPDLDQLRFEETDDIDEVLSKKSELLLYFSRPMTIDFDRYTYEDFFSEYTFSNEDANPKKRRKPNIAIMTQPSQANSELQSLRLLLRHFPARGFNDLKQGAQTFTQAAIRRQISVLNEDDLWISIFQMMVDELLTPSALLIQFANMLQHDSPAVRAIWETFWKSFETLPSPYDDIESPYVAQTFATDAPMKQRQFTVLRRLDSILLRDGKEIVDFQESLPIIKEFRDEFFLETYKDSKVKNYFHEQKQNRLPLHMIHSLNGQQLDVYQQATHQVIHETNKFIYINGSAGTGKTFLLNCIVSFVCQHMECSTCTFTGVAATELLMGMTIHSLFKFPIEEEEPADKEDIIQSRITEKTFQWKLFKSIKVLFIDEAVCVHLKYFAAIDQILRAVKSCDEPFGGITVVASGDFKQTLPINKI